MLLFLRAAVSRFAKCACFDFFCDSANGLDHLIDNKTTSRDLKMGRRCVHIFCRSADVLSSIKF